ncbi:hypothetical protein SISNIDRAFT_471315 [Sistotremastrum niveocremeum HHB9708]|uniref:Uncharacterized protein n=1 Tax=Sistotremastrum niveocremeum HHB9708 TaxID=1314777 RepID=A0A164MS36_9AGAM|nr:hypothetical protein SISNIDRAFT_471315 [Sistotremastrum niveocremeum HHB9708]
MSEPSATLPNVNPDSNPTSQNPTSQHSDIGNTSRATRHRKGLCSGKGGCRNVHPYSDMPGDLCAKCADLLGLQPGSAEYNLILNLPLTRKHRTRRNAVCVDVIQHEYPTPVARAFLWVPQSLPPSSQGPSTVPAHILPSHPGLRPMPPPQLPSTAVRDQLAAAAVQLGVSQAAQKRFTPGPFSLAGVANHITQKVAERLDTSALDAFRESMVGVASEAMIAVVITPYLDGKKKLNFGTLSKSYPETYRVPDILIDACQIWNSSWLKAPSNTEIKPDHIRLFFNVHTAPELNSCDLSVGAFYALHSDPSKRKHYFGPVAKDLKGLAGGNRLLVLAGHFSTVELILIRHVHFGQRVNSA